MSLKEAEQLYNLLFHTYCHQTKSLPHRYTGSSHMQVFLAFVLNFYRHINADACRYPEDGPAGLNDGQPRRQRQKEAHQELQDHQVLNENTYFDDYNIQVVP